MKQSTFKHLRVCDADEMPYAEAWELQRRIFAERKSGNGDDTLILLEHPHTYTLGKVAKREHLVYSDTELAEKGISVFDIDRGGDITYHGPGQLVGYPIIDLNNWKKDAHYYLRELEQVLIDVLNDYGVMSGRKAGLTGVWIEDRKIAAIGIKISSWITMHGFALNVTTDLGLFEGIIPCGIRDKAVTSLAKELQKEVLMSEVKLKIIHQFKSHFGYDLVLPFEVMQTISGLEI